MRTCMIALLCLAVPSVAAADPCCCEPPAQMHVVGGTFAIGVQSRTLPPDVRAGTTGPAFPQAYAIDQERTKSLWLAFGVEREGFTFAMDMSFGGASITGTTRDLPDPPFTSGSGPRPFSTSLLESSLAFRLGAHTQLGHLALAAGAGIGGTLYAATGGIEGPDGPSADWFIPVWAEATYKTSCDWGAQVLAESDRHDWNDQRSTGIAFGLVYQPDPACKN